MRYKGKGNSFSQGGKSGLADPPTAARARPQKYIPAGRECQRIVLSFKDTPMAREALGTWVLGPYFTLSTAGNHPRHFCGNRAAFTFSELF